jgi:transcriptional regulator with XRE-family HTH domain
MSEQRSDREIVLNRVAQNLRRARRLLGVSQETLGIRAGLHRSEIGMLENSERIPRIDTAVKLATALEIPVDQLVDGLTWEPPKPLGETGRFVADRPAGELRPVAVWKRTSSSVPPTDHDTQSDSGRS